MKDLAAGQASAASKWPGLKLLHPDFNIKLFEPVATLSGAGAEAEGITVAIRPFHSNPLREGR